MRRGRKILLCTLVLYAAFVGGAYSSSVDKHSAPTKDAVQLAGDIKVNVVAADSAVTVQKAAVKKPVAKKNIKKYKKPIPAKPKVKVEPIVEPNLGSIGELIGESQKEIKNVEKQDFVFEPIDLPEVSHYVILKYLRVEKPSLFVPTGQWFFGGTMQYSNHSNDNYKLLILDNWNGKGYSVSSKIYAGYAIKDNLAVGVRVGFGRTLLNIDDLSISLGDDLNFGIDHAHYINQEWSGAIFMRNFYSLFGSRQFGLFNDTEINLSGGRGKMITGTGDALKGTYESFFNASIGISPGIMVFMQNIAAIELSVGILGFSTGVTKQKTNQIYEGSRRTSGIKFGVDLFSIKLGATIYLNNRRFKQR